MLGSTVYGVCAGLVRDKHTNISPRRHEAAPSVRLSIDFYHAP